MKHQPRKQRQELEISISINAINLPACPSCGGTNIHRTAWVNSNNKVIDKAEGFFKGEWCEDCAKLIKRVG